MADAPEVGQRTTLPVRAMAHGGEGIADAPDGRVVFVRGAIPGDTVEVQLTKVKKRWARGDVLRVVTPSADRVEPVCPAAAAGAGCCDYSHIAPEAQLRYKTDILAGQLGVLARNSGVLDALGGPDAFDSVALNPTLGWRTRVRLGVDSAGRAGMRKAKSTDVVADILCAQAATGLLDGIVGSDARSFTPGAELIVVLDVDGQRHVVESTTPQRGRRAERIARVIEGSGNVTERIGTHEFTFPATAFWQAHAHAPEAYSELIEQWGSTDYVHQSGWDLYGGVGAFVPAIHAALGGGRVTTVDTSDAAASGARDAFPAIDWEYRHARVESGLGGLSQPGLVVLDPPRAGAGAEVVNAITAAEPERIIHIGCDPATFARDVGLFGRQGFVVKQMRLIDAFPQTHHFEVVAALTR
mgnify:FL=1